MPSAHCATVMDAWEVIVWQSALQTQYRAAETVLSKAEQCRCR